MNEKYKNLSLKIQSIINNKSAPCFDPNEKLSSSIEKLESTFETSVQSLDCKFNTLKEHIQKLKNQIEDEKNSKDEIKKKIFLDIKELETNLKNQMNEERQNVKIHAENIFKKLEIKMLNLKKQTEIDNQLIKDKLNYLKDKAESEVPLIKDRLCKVDGNISAGFDDLMNKMHLQFNKFNERIENNKKGSEENLNIFSKKLEDVFETIKQEFDKENSKKEDFEKNVVNILEETKNQIECQEK